MKLLIFGCCGYIGSRLTEYFLTKTKHSVVGVDSCRYNNLHIGASFAHKYKDFDFYNEDVRDIYGPLRDKIEKADIILMFHGLVGMPLCAKFSKEAEEVNSWAVGNIVEMLSKAQKVIYPNTNSVYGNNPNIITEESSTKALSVYAQTKSDGEKYVLEHSNSVSFRLGTAFGWSYRMRTDLLVPDFVYKICRHNGLKLYEPHFIRNFVGIDDIIRGVDWAIDNNKAGLFNLNHPDANISKAELAERIACRINKYAKIELVEGNDPDQRNANVSPQKIMGEGFRFRHNLEDGIDDTWDYLYDKTNEEIEGMRNI